MTYKNTKRAIFLPIIFSVILITGILIGNMLNNTENGKQFFIYPQNDKLSTVLDYIEEEYVDSVSRAELIEMTIPELLANLDPHSVYIPAKVFQSMNEPLEGNFDGIGIQFNIQKDTVIVVNTISGGPSEKIGILPGDRIVKVNDTLIAGIKISNNEVMGKLKGKRGTKVKVSILRKNYPVLIDFEIIRDKIPLYSVDVAYMLSEKTGYIKISKFAKTTYKEFKEAVSELKQGGMDKIIIDLRGNGGGYMDGAINIADEFLEEGRVIVYTEGKARPKTFSHATEKGVLKNDDVVILMDEWAASASEILAGAIQDNDRGLIIGRRSFGKGLVQEPTFFNDGSSLRLTIARYYTPTGRCIQKPYENGVDDYYYHIGNRYLNGELMHEDSTHFSDTLKYYTPDGKVVYGGGGIMPDIFVPADTTGLSDYLTKVANLGLIYRFAFEYTDNNRKILSKYDNFAGLEKHLDKKDLLIKFLSFAEKKGVKKNEEEIEISKHIIKTQINAYIARNILDNKGFYPIIRKIDKTLTKALELIEEK